MIQTLVIVLWLGVCAVQDIRQRQIANTLTLGVGLLALIYLLWAGSTWLGAPRSEGGLALALRLAIMARNFAAQPGRSSCVERSSASASAATFLVITLPEPM